MDKYTCLAVYLPKLTSIMPKQSIPGVAKDLFPASFISCWTELTGPDQQEFVRSLGVVLGSPNIPHEIITTLLNLSESMEHDNAQMPLDTRTLAALAWKCQAFAKALRYKVGLLIEAYCVEVRQDFSCLDSLFFILIAVHP